MDCQNRFLKNQDNSMLCKKFILNIMRKLKVRKWKDTLC